MLVLTVNGLSLAHSERTDSNGNHKDNKNVGGLGPYHYHCGGQPPIQQLEIEVGSSAGLQVKIITENVHIKKF